MLFYFSRGDSLTFCIPILLLTLADAAAALVGVCYGHFCYATLKGEKTLEGSVALLIVSFFCVHIPLLLFTNTGRYETLLIALNVAIAVTVLEAVACGGADNLLVPLAGFLVLNVSLGLDTARLLAFMGIELLCFPLFFLLFNATFRNFQRNETG